MVVYTFSGAASPRSVQSEVHAPTTHVVEVSGDEPFLVHVVEQVAVDPERFGLKLDDLVDVDVATTTTGAALTRYADGVWRGTRRVVPRPHVQSAPTLLVQVLHGLDYCPGGVTSIDTLGRSVEYDTISHPLPGVTELTYGVPFAGTVHLS